MDRRDGLRLHQQPMPIHGALDVTPPINIRADTPREAVEEVCKWLEERIGSTVVVTELPGLCLTANALRSAAIEPKEPTNG
jgi:hypothetical protein